MKTQRQGGRGARRERRRAQAASFDPAWRQWRNPYPPVEQFSVDEIEAIHTASMDVLTRIGLRVLCDEARERYRAGGMRVEDEVVRFDPDALMELIGHAPPEVTLVARGEGRDATIGRRHVSVATTGGTPNYSDIESGRQAGSLARFEDLCRLTQSYDVLHILGPLVEPQDVPIATRHLAMTRSAVTLTDKAPFVFYRGERAVSEAFEIIRLANGVDEETFRSRPFCYSIANSNSPLQLDVLMCQGIIASARMGQLMVLTPFTLAGAMAPVTLPGALVLQNAEALAGLALAQIVRPGAPVCYGSFTSNVDMRTGAPAFGTPEYAKAAFASGQLARRYDLPLRASGVTTSNAPDAQAAYEMQMSLWSTLMGGTNLLVHGAGWLEGGLTVSAEKFIMDVEMLQMFAELFKPVEVSPATLAIDAIADVGHGGHYFGTAHTIERYETAFYNPLLSDWNNFENWRDAGSVDATRRAHRLAKDTIAAFEPPPLAPDRREAINEYVARCEREAGTSVDA